MAKCLKVKDCRACPASIFDSHLCTWWCNVGCFEFEMKEPFPANCPLPDWKEQEDA